MFSKKQQELLENFADLSDKLFDLGVIRTDSFTGEIGEFIVCKLFDLEKPEKSTEAIDGISKNGEKYQIKAFVSGNNFTRTIQKLQPNKFDFLVVVFFDEEYNVLKIIKVSSEKINGNSFKILKSTVNTFEEVDLSLLKIESEILKSIKDFGKGIIDLLESKIIRSRKVVGDLGEFYAAKRLDLSLSEISNEKGIDAKDKEGRTFEIKTRRVYESKRRKSETRRLNKLIGKTADYLIVVTLNRSFKCSGMWIMPMQNIENPKSANLRIVNKTKETLNLIESKISWLKTGNKFIHF